MRIPLNKVMNSLMSESTRSTFLALQKGDATTEQIIENSKVSQTSCYRAISKLHSIGMVEIKNKVRDKKTLKDAIVWTTKFKSVSIIMDNGNLEIQD